MKICIVGGGPSGMMAALRASYYKNEVTIFEKKDRIGKKLLATGNGRCNFTNSNMKSSCYYCEEPSFVEDALSKFSHEDLLSFFSDLGLYYKNRNGYFYPASDQASTILDLLRNQLTKKNILVRSSEEVKRIKKDSNQFIVTTEQSNYVFDKVILACGGKAGLPVNEIYNGDLLLKDLAIQFSDTVPGLCPLYCKGLNFPALKGVRTDVAVSIYVDGVKMRSESGELLFTDHGLSGIVVFQLSRIAAYALLKKKPVQIKIDFFPQFSNEELIDFLMKRFDKHADESITFEEWFTGLLNKKLNIELIKRMGFRPTDLVTGKERSIFVQKLNILKEFEVLVSNVDDYKNAQVMAGGVKTFELHDTFECIKVPGLYVVGELLDVDGICGGYNLQWAFTSGFIAGEATRC